MKYIIEYYLPNQSSLFSAPQCVGFETRKDLDAALATAQKFEYDVIAVYEVFDDCWRTSICWKEDGHDC